jgi:GntR family transcriptional regulator, trigonelline degradation regulator
MAVGPLKVAVPSPLRQQVVDILRNAITECVFEPGGRLIERELCVMLRVSRTTLREGLRQLEAEGLLELAPNKGPVVPNLDHREASSVYAVRRELEGLACARCAERATEEDLSVLAQCLEAMTRALSLDNFKMLQHAKTEFYDRLCDCSGNPELKRILQRLRARVTLIRGLKMNRGARTKESVRGARAILDALRTGDPIASRRAAEHHIELASELALEAMRSDLLVEPPGLPLSNATAVDM